MPDFERDLAATQAAIDPLDAAVRATARRLHSARARLACPAQGADPLDLQADIDLLRATLEDLGRARSRLGHRVRRIKAKRRAWRIGPLRALQRAEIDRITALPVDERRAALDASNVELTWEQDRVLRRIVAEDGKHPLEPAHRKPKTIYAVDILHMMEASPDFSFEGLTQAIIRRPYTSTSFSNMWDH